MASSSDYYSPDGGNFGKDVVVVGGGGHAGLPLGLAFATTGLKVVLYDIDEAAVNQVNAGRMPFRDLGADEALRECLASGLLEASSDPSVISYAAHVIVVVGTPVDEHLNPTPQAVPETIQSLLPHLRSGQLLVLGSTVFPGVTALVEKLFADSADHLKLEVAFCPERIAEGQALKELFQLPQIVSGRNESALGRAADLYKNLTNQILKLSPEEAELAKLFTNTWRYIKFATANQFYMIANDYGLDFERIRQALTFDYPRASDMPKAGFAAGPCLLKDTLQLAAFNNNNFVLGHAAMMVNEGLPLYVVARMEKKFDLPAMTVGILGMAFKAESDDTRSSLSFKLKRILGFKSRQVLCADPYLKDHTGLASLDEVMETADVLVVAAPHKCFRTLKPTVPVVDIWNLFGNGVGV